MMAYRANAGGGPPSRVIKKYVSENISRSRYICSLITLSAKYPAEKNSSPKY